MSADRTFEPIIEITIRGKPVIVPGTVSRRLGQNSFSVRIPRNIDTERLLGRRWTAEAFDGLVLSVDGREAVHVLGSADDPGGVVVAVIL